MRISVIVPIFNIKEYLAKCVNSIIEQEYPDLEIILVDDGSTDGCEIMCDEFGRQDSRIKVIHKANGGLVSARKAGAAVCTGEYTMNVDGDDWIEKDYIRGFCDSIEQSKADIIWNTEYFKDYEEYTVLCQNENKEDEEFIREVCGEKGFRNRLEFSLWLKCIRTEYYNEIQQTLDDRIKHHEDMCMILRLLSKHRNIHFEKIKGYHYVQRKTSIVHLSDKDNSDEIMLNDTEKYLEGCTNIRIKTGLLNQLYGSYGRVKMLHDFYEIQTNATCLVPFSKIRERSNVAVYGAGLIGEIIAGYIYDTNKYSLAIWVDKNLAGKEKRGIRIFGTDFLLTTPFDYVVIATTKTVFSDEIYKELLELGVSEEKIQTIDEDLLWRQAHQYFIRTGV